MLTRMTDTNREFDCVVVGSCVVDLLCRPVDLHQPIGAGPLPQPEPLAVTAGGITANSGITMSRMGVGPAVFSYVGDDAWQGGVRGIFEADGGDTQHLAVHPTQATSTTVVTIAPDGERSFALALAAHAAINKAKVDGEVSMGRDVTRLTLVGGAEDLAALAPSAAVPVDRTCAT